MINMCYNTCPPYCANARRSFNFRWLTLHIKNKRGLEFSQFAHDQTGCSVGRSSTALSKTLRVLGFNNYYGLVDPSFLPFFSLILALSEVYSRLKRYEMIPGKASRACRVIRFRVYSSLKTFERGKNIIKPVLIHLIFGII